MIGYGYLFSLLYVVLVIGLSALLYRFGVQKAYTRKFIHIFVSFEWVILYHFMGTSLHFFAVCVFFFFLLLLAYVKRLFPMMSSDGGNAPGTVYYAAAMSVLSLITYFVPEMILPFGVGVFATSFGDGFAGALGQAIRKKNPKIFGEKTLIGSLSCFVITTLSSYLIFLLYGAPLGILHALAIAAFATGAELLTSRGLDNITVTFTAAALTFFFLKVPTAGNYLVPILATPFVVMLVAKRKALTPDGIAAALFLDLAVSVSLGNFGFLTLLFFFLVAMLADGIKKEKKAKLLSEREAKGTRRDGYQVLANAVLPVTASIFFLITKKTVFLIAFVAGMAEALADTAASAIGVLSSSAFDLFHLRRCERGISGGMSWLGTGTALLCAFALSFFTCLFGEVTPVYALLATVAAFLGSIFDSFLGSVFQVKYRCTVCRRLTEKTICHGMKTERVRGISFLDNDIVNLFSSLFAILVAVGGYFLLFR